MLVFVAIGTVEPDWTAYVEVNAAHDGHLARAHSRQSLQPHHCSYLTVEMRKCAVDDVVCHRPDRFLFTSHGSAALEPFDREQGLKHGRRNKFLCDCPPEDSLDPAHPLIDHATRQVARDHLLPNSLQREGTKVSCKLVAVKGPHRRHGDPVLSLLGS